MAPRSGTGVPGFRYTKFETLHIVLVVRDLPGGPFFPVRAAGQITDYQDTMELLCFEFGVSKTSRCIGATSERSIGGGSE